MFKLQAVETQGARWINENLFNSEVYATKSEALENKKISCFLLQIPEDKILIVEVKKK